MMSKGANSSRYFVRCIFLLFLLLLLYFSQNEPLVGGIFFPITNRDKSLGNRFIVNNSIHGFCTLTYVDRGKRLIKTLCASAKRKDNKKIKKSKKKKHAKEKRIVSRSKRERYTNSIRYTLARSKFIHENEVSLRIHFPA